MISRIFTTSCVFAGFFGLSTQAAANPTLALCANEGLRATCLATCAVGCTDAEFIGAHVNYCVDNNFFDPGARASAKDNANCATIFGAATGGGTETTVVVTNPITPTTTEGTAVTTEGTTPAVEEKDCSAITPISARRRCELNKFAPVCAPTFVELEQRASLLITDIKDEVGTYGDLLTRDYSIVAERDALCEFKLSQLDESYAIANENPIVLRSLQRQAQEIQACQTDWEVFVRGYEPSGGSDQLIDNVVRAAEQGLDPLKNEIAELSTSINKLENAKQTIVGIIDLHIFYCKEDGNGSQ